MYLSLVRENVLPKKLIKEDFSVFYFKAAKKLSDLLQSP